MTERAVIGVASSAGGIRSLLALTAGLPPAFPAGILIAQHLGPAPSSKLARVLARSCSLPVRAAVDGEAVAPGVVVVCPTGAHIAVEPGPRLCLKWEGPLHFVRPSADLLFESVAAAYGERAIAVVLTGTGHDGSMGVTAVKKRHGTVIVQDEGSSEFFGMPSAAIKTGAVDFILALDEIPGALQTLVSGEAD